MDPQEDPVATFRRPIRAGRHFLMTVLRRFLRFVFLGGCLGNLVGFIILSALFGGCFLVILLTASQTARASAPYRLALSEIQRSPEAQARLGLPIEDGWLVTRRRAGEGIGTAQSLIFPVYGPQTAGTAYATLELAGDSWRIVDLVLEVDGVFYPLQGESGRIEGFYRQEVLF